MADTFSTDQIAQLILAKLRRNFGRTLLAGGAVTSPLIPWNTCGIYCSSILGIGAARYLPFVLFSLITPVYMIVVGFFHDYRNRRRAAEQALAETEDQLG